MAVVSESTEQTTQAKNEFGIDHTPLERFEIMGAPKPHKPFGLPEHLRFQHALSHLAPGSVLDIGAYLGDFLKLAKAQGREIAGTEVNEARCATANQAIGKDVVIVDFLDGVFQTFKENQFDNVVCMEVIEHLPDDSVAVKELCRIAKKRVIITVPFDENIVSEMCIHCHQWTPRSGHLRSYNLQSFQKLLPDSSWRLASNHVLVSRYTTALARRLPGQSLQAAAGPAIDRIVRRTLNRRAKWIWMMAVLEKRS